jgi:hypothetical protein
LLPLLCAIAFVLPSNGISTKFCPKNNPVVWQWQSVYNSSGVPWGRRSNISTYVVLIEELLILANPITTEAVIGEGQPMRYSGELIVSGQSTNLF